jgi:co-chaperonin GroES (HSP10)
MSKKVVGLSPLGANVLLSQWQKVTRQGLIVMPEDVVRAPSVGEVVAVGHGVTYPVKVGDTVTFTEYAGEQILLETQPEATLLLLVPQESLVGVCSIVDVPDAAEAEAAV